MGETCGTVTGALIIIGLKYGTADINDKLLKAKTYELVGKFVKAFKARNNSITCRDLVGFDIGSRRDLTGDDWAVISKRCPKYVRDAAEIIEEILKT